MKCCLIALALLAAAAMAQLTPLGLPGQWWKQPRFADWLSLTADQQKKLDDVFQQNRVKLIDSTAALDREEAIIEQLMAAEPLDVAKIRPQIDRVSQARAELEKVNANMLLSMRLILTKGQWETLRDSPPRPGRGPLPRKVR